MDAAFGIPEAPRHPDGERRMAGCGVRPGRTAAPGKAVLRGSRRMRSFARDAGRGRRPERQPCKSRPIGCRTRAANSTWLPPCACIITWLRTRCATGSRARSGASSSPAAFSASWNTIPFNPATRLIVRRTPVDADARLLTAGESRALLAGCGFRVLEREFFLYLPERMYRAAPFVESWLRKVPLGGQYAVFGEKHT